MQNIKTGLGFKYKYSCTIVFCYRPEAIPSEDNLIGTNSAEGDKHKLKTKVLNMILHLLKSKYGMEETIQTARTVTLEELNIEWHKRNPNKKFKDYKCGKTLKSFLIEECGIQESTQDKLEFVPATIKALLQGTSDLPTQESDCDRKEETSTTNCKSKKQPEGGVPESE